MDIETKNRLNLLGWELYALASGLNQQDAREFYSSDAWGITELGRIHKMQDRMCELFRELQIKKPEQVSDPIADIVAKLTDRQKDALLELYYTTQESALYFSYREDTGGYNDLEKLWTDGMAVHLCTAGLIEENVFKMIRLTALGRDVIDYLRS